MYLEKKVCVITGASAGIGKATAITLAKNGNTIIMLVRDSDKSRQAYKEINAASVGAEIHLLYVDLSSMDSIRKVAEKISNKYSHIDILINNAGVLKRKPELSVDGIEMTYAVNLFAPFLLTNQLLPLVEKSQSARIINLTSELYKKGKIEFDGFSSLDNFNSSKAYANSKLMVVINTLVLSNKLKDKNITVNCVHPGVVGTDVMRDYPKWLSKLLNIFISKPEVGAEPTIFLATSPEMAKITGKYYSKMTQSPVIDIASNEVTANQVWAFCEKITG
ncbi:MAG: SDR family oxidoreductase [Candidatus Marinimicrobia bacterium]|nr:SDR family oxidoreductase [Candidatus Neomarinimicrobiota bacterium]